MSRLNNYDDKNNIICMFPLFQINLVCGDSMLVSHAQTAFYFGVLVGSIAFGQLSDM